MVKRNLQHNEQTQTNQVYDNLIKDLSLEIKQEQSLAIIENAMWSMRALIIGNEQIEKKTREDYEQLFNIAIPRIEQLVSIIDRGFLNQSN